MKLACKDLDPKSDCDFESVGNSKTETAGIMLDHVKADHPEKIIELNMSNEEMMKMFEGRVYE